MTNDRDETIALMQGAIAFHIEGLAAEGLPIPLPHSETAVVEVNAVP